MGFFISTLFNVLCYITVALKVQLCSAYTQYTGVQYYTDEKETVITPNLVNPLVCFTSSDNAFILTAVEIYKCYLGLFGIGKELFIMLDEYLCQSLCK